MNLSQLETLVWSWLDDVNGAYFTKPQVDVWINNAQREVQKLLIQTGQNYYVEKMSGVMVINKDTYFLPSDFKKCHKLEIVTSGVVGSTSEVRATMEWCTLMQLESIWQSVGTPILYNIKRNMLTVRPIPDQAYTMYLHQSYKCVDMVNPSDLPDVPEDFTEYIAVIATLDGFLKDQRDPSAFVGAKKEKYELMLKQDANDRNVSKPKSVVVTEMAGGVMF